MASILRDLRVDWASLVDEPANKGARIMLFKRDDTAALAAEIEKAGRKMSGRRLNALKEATKNLMSILNEVDDEKPEEEDEMSKSAETQVEATEIEKRLVDLEKRLADEVSKREAAEKIACDEIAKREHAECVEIAKSFDSISIDADVVRAIRKLDEGDRAKVLECLTAANKAAQTGKLTTEIGKSGGEGASPIERLNAMAADMVTKGEAKTHAQAVVKVAERNPELYRDYVASRAARA